MDFTTLGRKVSKKRKAHVVQAPRMHSTHSSTPTAASAHVHIQQIADGSPINASSSVVTGRGVGSSGMQHASRVAERLAALEALLNDEDEHEKG